MLKIELVPYVSRVHTPPYCSKQMPGRRKSHKPTPTLISFNDCIGDLAWAETDLIITGGDKVMLDRVEVNCMKGMTAACKQSVNQPIVNSFKVKSYLQACSQSWTPLSGRGTKCGHHYMLSTLCPAA